MKIEVDSSWNNALRQEFESDYLKKIAQILDIEHKQGTIIFPPKELIFNAFNICDYNNIKVVILGQDPYHQFGQAMGLSFSVPHDCKIPPSLKNIFKELVSQGFGSMPKSGNLESWTRQGVLLLNTTLTVIEGKPNSHKKIGWQFFTQNVLKQLSFNKTNLVFILWGNEAISKKNIIDESKHLVLTAAHPSPLARAKFFGNQHFVQANEYLRSHSIDEINWSLQ